MAKDHHKDFERLVDNAIQNQVIGSNTDEETKNAVDSAVIAFEKCMPDTNLTAMNNMVDPLVEIAVRSIRVSSGNGPDSKVQNPDWRDLENTENTPLRSASSRLDLNNEQDETRDIINSENVDFPATRFLYERRAQAHHIVTGRNAP